MYLLRSYFIKHYFVSKTLFYNIFLLYDICIHCLSNCIANISRNCLYNLCETISANSLYKQSFDIFHLKNREPIVKIHNHSILMKTSHKYSGYRVIIYWVIIELIIIDSSAIEEQIQQEGKYSYEITRYALKSLFSRCDYFREGGPAQGVVDEKFSGSDPLPLWPYMLNL